MVDAARVFAQPVVDGPLPLCKGYQQLDSTALAASVGLTVPAGTTTAIIQATTAPIRWRADGVDPTASVGMLIADGGEILYSASEDALAALRFIRTSAGAVLNVSYY
jgi:hypothetical protein